MTATADVEDSAPAKKSKLPLLLGLVLALAGGGGAFFVVSSGMLGGGGESADAAKDGGHEAAAADGYDAAAAEGEAHGAATGPAAFVPVDPLVVSIPDIGGTRFLRFSAQLEVQPETQEAVAQLMPRIVDVMNSYLRAVSLDELSDPNILMRLRGQLLRRIQVVTGPGQVRDLLIMEFVLN